MFLFVTVQLAVLKDDSYVLTILVVLKIISKRLSNYQSILKLTIWLIIDISSHAINFAKFFVQMPYFQLENVKIILNQPRNWYEKIDNRDFFLISRGYVWTKKATVKDHFVPQKETNCTVKKIGVQSNVLGSVQNFVHFLN